MAEATGIECMHGPEECEGDMHLEVASVIVALGVALKDFLLLLCCFVEYDLCCRAMYLSCT